MNVLFDYMYRDADNYKESGTAVFSNPNDMSLNEADHRLRRCLVDSDNFNARQVGVPDAFPDRFDPDRDHAYHEYCGLEPIDRAPTDARTLSQFVADFEREFAKGWAIDDDRAAFGSLEWELLRNRVDAGQLTWKEAVAMNRARIAKREADAASSLGSSGLAGASATQRRTRPENRPLGRGRQRRQ